MLDIESMSVKALEGNTYTNSALRLGHKEALCPDEVQTYVSNKTGLNITDHTRRHLQTDVKEKNHLRTLSFVI